MVRFLISRLFQALVLVIVMSMIVFVGVYSIGDPVDILVSPDCNQLCREEATRILGLDRPLQEQYLTFLGHALEGDLGRSFAFGSPALALILDRMPATLELALMAMIIALAIGLPAGMVAGLKPNSVAGRTIMAGSILGFSLPTFWVGLMLIMVFAVQFGWLPSTGRGDVGSFLGIQSSLFTLDGLAHIILPAFNLSLFKMALVIRMTRAGMQEAMLQDYIRFARARGLRPRRIVMVHAFRNIMIPLVTVIGLEFGAVIAFAVVTETIFAWPGMGKLIIDSINVLDRPVIVAYLMVTVFLFIVINLVVDLLYSALDPRVRLEELGA
jgi:peptide/nickel transport system permease protein